VGDAVILQSPEDRAEWCDAFAFVAAWHGPAVHMPLRYGLFHHMATGAIFDPSPDYSRPSDGYWASVWMDAMCVWRAEHPRPGEPDGQFYKPECGMLGQTKYAAQTAGYVWKNERDKRNDTWIAWEGE
jgi:hypothetical protein